MRLSFAHRKVQYSEDLGTNPHTIEVSVGLACMMMSSALFLLFFIISTASIILFNSNAIPYSPCLSVPKVGLGRTKLFGVRF
jgi:hypothetical protein